MSCFKYVYIDMYVHNCEFTHMKMCTHRLNYFLCNYVYALIDCFYYQVIVYNNLYKM